MKVSVIIPVYNAGDFVSQAVQSALNQPQTAEVILVEDGSQDHSLAVCSELASQHERVHLYHHPDHANLGASATRNLGIQQAVYPFIAFLDADDYYLPDRFQQAEAVFNQYPDADGVYEAVGTLFMDEASRQQWTKAGRADGITTITAEIAPEELLEALLFDRHGAFHTNGVTFKREVFKRSGLFDLHLRLHQDTALWLKIASTSRLYGGKLREPVAMRRVHQNNRISASRTPENVYQTRMMMSETVFRWAEANPDLTNHQKSLITEAYFIRSMVWDRQNASRLTHTLKIRGLLLKLLLKHPQFALKKSFWGKLLPSSTY